MAGYTAMDGIVCCDVCTRWTARPHPVRIEKLSDIQSLTNCGVAQTEPKRTLPYTVTPDD